MQLSTLTRRFNLNENGFIIRLGKRLHPSLYLCIPLGSVTSTLMALVVVRTLTWALGVGAQNPALYCISLPKDFLISFLLHPTGFKFMNSKTRALWAFYFLNLCRNGHQFYSYYHFNLPRITFRSVSGDFYPLSAHSPT